MPTPPLLVLVAAAIISLSLLVSADLPSENTTGSTHPAPANYSRPGRHHRGGIGIQIANGIVNASGAADLPSDNTTGNTHTAPANYSRPGRHHRGGIGIQSANGVVNESGANVTTPVKRANLFLEAHNAVRARIGEPPLVWDRNLARYARNWASGRVSDCKMIHSGGPYGENIFWGSKDRWTAIQIVNMWVGEVQYYDPVHNSCQDGEICGHYTQVVWRDSNKVGCSRVTCTNGGMYAICVYDPPGNYIGENPFAHNDW